MDATEDKVLGLGLGRIPRQLERIPPKIGQGQHLVPLVVVAQDHQPLTEGRFQLCRPRGEIRGLATSPTDLHADVERRG